MIHRQSTFGRDASQFRRAAADEVGRAASLCQPLPARPGDAPSRCFVAVRARPVERLVAAAFWTVAVETDGTLTAEVKWSALPGLENEIGAFLDALVAHVADCEPAVATMTCAEWLPVGHPAIAVLHAAGFSKSATRTFFQADAAAWRQALCESPGPGTEAVVVPPHAGHFDELRTLLCGASLRPSELALGFQTAHTESPSLFDPRCSGVLIESAKMVAACLANASHGHLTVARMAGAPDACATLLRHCLHGRDHLPEPSTLGFHTDERDPASSLAPFIDHLPHVTLGQLACFARPFSDSANASPPGFSHKTQNKT